MNTHDHDNDALPGEEELKSLYRSLPRKEPSPALDSAIQRAAADAVRADQRRSVTRWPVAVASVAVLVVAAGLGWRTMQQPTSLPQGPASRTVVVSAAPANEPAQAMSAQSSAELAKAPAAPLAAAAPEARIAAPVAAKRDNIRSAMKTNVVAPVVATEQPPAPATEPAPLTAMSEDRMAAAAPPPAPAAPAPVADAAPSAYAPQTAMRATAISGALSQRATAMKVMAAPAAAPDSTAANANDTPAQELEKIRQLFALHRHDEAVQRLTAFRQAHPDVPLPDDLRAQLPDHE